MEKRYQVFVSSTFTDLQVERQEILQALLELDCIPSGMELFPAADEDQWSLIKRVITDCDYYILVSGGRYGSIGPGGKSYTHLEYEYAIEQGKPVIAFLHKDFTALPASLVESEKEAREQLIEFRKICEKKLVKYWTDAKELGSIVSRSIVRLMRDRPAIGWIRADALPSEDTSKEMLRLRGIIDDLQKRIDTSRSGLISDTSNLLQGDDTISVEFNFRALKADDRPYQGVTYRVNEGLKFSNIFSRVSPALMNEASEKVIEDLMGELLYETFSEKYKSATEANSVGNFELYDTSFQTIKVQMVALGLISPGEKKRPVQDSKIYWKLTQEGEFLMMTSRALRRPNSQN